MQSSQEQDHRLNFFVVGSLAGIVYLIIGATISGHLHSESLNQLATS